MAGHEYAKVNVAIWGDQDWKKLTRDEHWLYFLLWSHPKTNAAGVADWRPGRLASSAAQTTAEDVRRIAAQLQAKRFILVDEESEEVLIRSYLKHDQRMKQPNASVSVANAYSGTASLPIQKVIVYELGRLKERQPTYKGWESRAIQDVLSQDGRPIDLYIDPSTDPSDDPRVDPSVSDQTKVSVDPSVGHPLTETYTETLSTYVESAPPKRSRKKPETTIPDDWTPTEAHAAKAKEKAVHLDTEAEAFKLHAETHDRRLVNWNAAFTMWLTKARPSGGPNGATQGGTSGPPYPPRQSGADAALQRGQERHEQMADYQPVSWADVFTPKQIGDGT